MKLYLKTLTPLHIGTGTELEPIDYVIVNKCFYRIPQTFCFHFLQEKALLEKYTQWTNETADKISNLENQIKKNRGIRDLNQQLSDLRKNFNLLQFCQLNRVEKEFIHAINKSESITKIPLEGGSPDKKIREQIKNGTNTPYIPGSSIKGAIRTALLYKWLCDKKAVQDLKKIIEKDLQEKDIKKEHFANKIENLAFYCGIETKNSGIKYDDEKFDLLKLLSISDGKITSPGTPLTLVKTLLYLIDNTRQQQAPWVEAIAPNSIIEFTIDINLNFLFAVKNKIKDDAIFVEGRKQWIGIASKTKEIFGIDIFDLTPENLNQAEHHIINHILHAVNIFCDKQIARNEQWKKSIKSEQTRRRNRNTQLFNKNKVDFAFLNNKRCLNLGFASGFTGTTEFLFILDNPELKIPIKKVMEKFGIGDSPSAQNNRKRNKTVKNYEANPDNFPKSRTMYEENGKIKPLGWLQILLPEELTTIQHTPEQQTVTAPPVHTPTPTPQYHTGKIKPYTVVQGICVGKDEINPAIKKIKLFIGEPGQEPVVNLRYTADLDPNRLLKITITGIQANKITTVQFAGFVN